jgi:tRNA threonylcarbamoyl adenosine modification protein YjeE
MAVCAISAVLFTVATIGSAFAEDVYVEYVQSDRAQNHAVNVGYKPTPRTKIVVDYAFVDTTTVQQRVFGITGEAGSAAIQHYINGAGNLAYTCYNDANAGWWALSSATAATTDRRTFILDIPSRYACAQQGSTYLCSHTHSVQVTNTTKRTLAIFASKAANNTLTSNSDCSSMKFYSMQIYEDGRIPLYHYDAYRIDDPGEMEEIGYTDYFYGDGACLIEWACNIEEFLPEHYSKISVERDNDKGFDYRKITVTKI